MKERPILFSSEMVRAILEGRKTQTRRAMKRQPECKGALLKTPGGEMHHIWPHQAEDGRMVDYFCKCPYGLPGDRLWVRETWDFVVWDSASVLVLYGADGGQSRPLCYPKGWNPMMYNYERWRPSIYMPRWASRIELEITNIRVERVKEISNADARAEGVGWWQPVGGEKDYRLEYSMLWNRINAKRGYGWASNPWVWVIEFRVIDAIGAR